MKRTFTLLAGGVVAAGLGAGVLAQHEGHGGGHGGATVAVTPKAVPGTLVGELIDMGCYVSSEGNAKGKDHATCAGKCLGSGVPAGILPEGSKDAESVLFLLTNPTVLAPYAGQTIKVEGTPHPKMHGFDVKRLFVKDGARWKEVQLKDEHHKMGGGGHEGHEGHGGGGGDAKKPASGPAGHGAHQH